MDSLFAKVIFFSSFLLALISGPAYIKIDRNDLSFNFQTGEIFPIYYYLNTQNIGSKKARFEISFDSDWISGYREGTNYTFVELPPQAYINFVLEIRPERLPDGINKAKVFIKVLDIDSLVSQEIVLDKIEVSVTLKKNIVPTETPEPALIPVSTEILSPTQNPPTFSPTPAVSLIPLPRILMPKLAKTPIPVPVQTLSPGPSPDLNPILKQLQSLIDSLRFLLKKIF